MAVTIDTRLINQVKYVLFTMAYILAFPLLTFGLAIMLHFPLLIIGSLGGVFIHIVYDKKVKKLFSWMATFTFSDSMLEVGEYNKITVQIEKTEHISYSEIRSFYIFTGKNSIDYLRLYMKDGRKIIYRSVPLEKSRIRINKEVYNQFAQYDKSAHSENKIQYIPSDLATKRGKIMTIIFLFLIPACIVLASMYKRELLPISICFGGAFLFAGLFISAITPGRVRAWKKISE